MARVLIVEDESTDLIFMRNIVEVAGHEVYVATDGEAAFKAFLRKSIDVVVTDLHMPHVDGLELIGAVRALYPEARIIAVSGKGQDLLDAAKLLGASVALSKPLDPNELLEAIAPAASDEPVKGIGAMQGYARRGVSNVVAYVLGDDSITVQFDDRSRYLYTYEGAGAANVEEMKNLARRGEGLNEFIKKNVSTRDAKKLR